ncbi:MAG: response regulator [Anaerolineae bacterium]|nr:response regulator [Anaerolineae bacterium]
MEEKAPTPKNFAFVIEDDEDQAYVFDSALRMAGFDAETITDGTTAQKRIAEEVPQIIILDLHLPGIRGDQLLQQIRSDDRLENTQVIVTTADAALAESLEDEAALVLLKPVSFTQLSTLAARFRPPQEDSGQP